MESGVPEKHRWLKAELRLSLGHVTPSQFPFLFPSQFLLNRTGPTCKWEDMTLSSGNSKPLSCLRDLPAASLAQDSHHFQLALFSSGLWINGSSHLWLYSHACLAADMFPTRKVT